MAKIIFSDNTTEYEIQDADLVSSYDYNFDPKRINKRVSVKFIKNEGISVDSLTTVLTDELVNKFTIQDEDKETSFEGCKIDFISDSLLVGPDIISVQFVIE